MDARLRYTLNMIRQSLLSLLKEKSIEKITVREICQLAGINRTTFYRHYENQYDLLATLQDEMFEEIQTQILSQQPEPDELILLMFQLVYRNKEDWLVLMGENADPRISNRISDFIADYFKVQTKSKSGKMKYRFIACGAAGLFEDWVNSGMKETPDEMAAYLNSYSRALSGKNH